MPNRISFSGIFVLIGAAWAFSEDRRRFSMIGGALATFMIACVAGTFYSGRSMLGL